MTSTPIPESRPDIEKLAKRNFRARLLHSADLLCGLVQSDYSMIPPICRIDPLRQITS